MKFIMKFTTQNYPWSVNGLINCIKDNELSSEIIFHTKNSAIIKVNSFEDSKILGAMSEWCIAEHLESWKKYVSDENYVQLYFFNFNPDVEDKIKMIGVTYTTDGEYKYGFLKNDDKISSIYHNTDDEESIFNSFILKEFFGNINIPSLITFNKKMNKYFWEKLFK